MFKIFSERFLYRDKLGKGSHEGMIAQPSSFSKINSKQEILDEIAKSKRDRLKEQDEMKANFYDKPVEDKELSENAVVEKFARKKMDVISKTQQSLALLADDVFLDFLKSE